MSTFAILGATGATGQQIVKLLLRNPDDSVHLYVRNTKKLFALFPGIESNNQARIFQGSMNDANLIASCIASTRAVFAVLASNDNIPGMTIAVDSAVAVLSAMTVLRENDKSAPLPRVVVLSSVTVNPLLYKSEPKIIHWIINHAFWHVYRDLENAEKLYAEIPEDGSPKPDVRFVHPGAIVEGNCSGSVILSQQSHSAVVSYGDVARAMVQAGEDVDLKWNNVGVLIDGGDLSFTPGIAVEIAGRLVKGLLWTFVPWIPRVARRLSIL